MNKRRDHTSDSDEHTVSQVGPFDPPIHGGPVIESEAEAESEGVIRSGKLAGKSLPAAIWLLAMPVLIQQTMQACVGMADKILAGDLREAIRIPALDAVGVGSYIGWFIGIAMAGLGIGGQAIIARSMGSGNLRQAQHALGQALTLSVLWSAFIGALLWFGAIWVARLTMSDPQAIEYCVQYVRVYAVAMPFTGIMMVGSMCLHGAGETLRPSAIAVIVNIANILFSWVLSGVDLEFGGRVFENPSPFNLDVIGIAAGTSLSYVLGAILTLYVVVRGVKDLRLVKDELPLDPSMAKRIVRVGVPNFMEGISMWAVNLFVLIFIGWIDLAHGTGGGLQGAHIIAIQWEAFSFMPGFAIGTAAGALAGQFLGAGNPKMAQKAVMACTGMAVLVMGGLGILFMTQGELLTSIISKEAIHLEQVPRLLYTCGTVQVFFAITMVFRQGLRGVGDTTWTFIITTVSSYGVRLPAAYLFGVVMGYGLAGIWFALCGEFVVRALLFSARFFHGGWKKIQI